MEAAVLATRAEFQGLAGLGFEVRVGQGALVGERVLEEVVELQRAGRLEACGRVGEHLPVRLGPEDQAQLG